jgi:hypothetical protein
MHYLNSSLDEWIGIILDEPKGKNNGTVEKSISSGILYRIEIVNYLFRWNKFSIFFM